MVNWGLVGGGENCFLCSSQTHRAIGDGEGYELLDLCCTSLLSVKKDGHGDPSHVLGDTGEGDHWVNSAHLTHAEHGVQVGAAQGWGGGCQFHS